MKKLFLHSETQKAWKLYIWHRKGLWGKESLFFYWIPETKHWVLGSSSGILKQKGEHMQLLPKSTSVSPKTPLQRRGRSRQRNWRKQTRSPSAEPSGAAEQRGKQPLQLPPEGVLKGSSVWELLAGMGAAGSLRKSPTASVWEVQKIVFHFRKHSIHYVFFL